MPTFARVAKPIMRSVRLVVVATPAKFVSALPGTLIVPLTVVVGASTLPRTVITPALVCVCRLKLPFEPSVASPPVVTPGAVARTSTSLFVPTTE